MRYLKDDWSLDRKRRLLAWHQTTAAWQGGHSFVPYLENIVGASFERFSPQDRKTLLMEWAKRPYASGLLLRRSNPDQVADFEEVIAGMVEDVESKPGQVEGEALIASAVDALAKSAAPRAKEVLRSLFSQYPDRRDQLARSLARRPQGADWPLLVRSLQGGSNATMQLSIQALRRLKRKPTKPNEYRQVILAGLKLGKQAGLPAAELLARWTGDAHTKGLAAPQALAHYQKWFAKRFPDQPPPELAKAGGGKSKYSYQQLLRFLDQSPAGESGDVARGKAIFAKVNCLKCHKFLNEGAGVGPDLTSVRRRFQRKEIIESLVYPSQVISDQYRSVTVVTVDGLVHTGMPLPQAGNRSLVLLLPDATKLEIPSGKIDQRAPAKLSVMPEGALNKLTLQDIADLFAFLETSKSNPTSTQPPSNGDGK